jgi:hypothetical protein
MSRRKSIPAYRRHKATGQAVVTLPDRLGARRDVYLNTHGSPESRREHVRVLTEWEVAGHRLPPKSAE